MPARLPKKRKIEKRKKQIGIVREPSEFEIFPTITMTKKEFASLKKKPIPARRNSDGTFVIIERRRPKK
ncbi:MAG: hypothetical protein Q7S21_06835 [archaeon]|nr:hypothetical protein [archaeon]